MSRVLRGAGPLAAVILLGASSISAQTPVEFGLGGGITIPTGPTNDGLKSGWHGMALVLFRPASIPVGFQIDGSYQRLGVDGGGGHFQIIDGTGNIVYNFAVSNESQFRPYLIGGGGVYNVKAVADAGASVSDTKFGANLGAGFNFKSSGVGFYVEGRYHNVFASGADFHFIPITVGFRFGGS